MVICLERGAYLHMAQLMPPLLTVSCSSKIQIGFTFLVPAHLGSPGQRAVKRVCVCVLLSLLICEIRGSDCLNWMRILICATIKLLGWTGNKCWNLASIRRQNSEPDLPINENVARFWLGGIWYPMSPKNLRCYCLTNDASQISLCPLCLFCDVIYLMQLEF